MKVTKDVKDTKKANDVKPANINKNSENTFDKVKYLFALLFYYQCL